MAKHNYNGHCLVLKVLKLNAIPSSRRMRQQEDLHERVTDFVSRSLLPCEWCHLARLRRQLTALSPSWNTRYQGALATLAAWRSTHESVF